MTIVEGQMLVRFAHILRAHAEVLSTAAVAAIMSAPPESGDAEANALVIGNGLYEKIEEIKRHVEILDECAQRLPPVTP